MHRSDQATPNPSGPAGRPLQSRGPPIQIRNGNARQKDGKDGVGCPGGRLFMGMARRQRTHPQHLVVGPVPLVYADPGSGKSGRSCAGGISRGSRFPPQLYIKVLISGAQRPHKGRCDIHAGKKAWTAADGRETGAQALSGACAAHGVGTAIFHGSCSVEEAEAERSQTRP